MVMEHIKTLQNHPNRDWILAGIGAATLICAYACYRCCCRKETTKVEEVSKEASYHKIHNNEDEKDTRHESIGRKSTLPQGREDILSKLGGCKCPDLSGQGGCKYAEEVGAKKSGEVRDTTNAKDDTKRLCYSKYIPPPSNSIGPPSRNGLSMFSETRPSIRLNSSVLGSTTRSNFRASSIKPQGSGYIRASQHLGKPVSSKTADTLKVAQGYR